MKPNVLWIMSDQHNANCTGYRQHPNVRTPNLDRIAAGGVDFTQAYVNNPVCSPSRICLMTGQYVHTHGFHGNVNFEYPESNPHTLACQLRRYGYQTALIGKSHMVGRWDREGFEHVRYCDMADAERGDPTTNHYFQYLDRLGLADFYEEGTPKPGQAYTMDGSGPARLPYEHSIERFTGRETLEFLETRDKERPFFVKMSFQRPHAPISPSVDHFDMYDPEEIVLPDSAVDYLERRFAGKPAFMREMLKDGCSYPLADPNPERLKRCLASYYSLITVIDQEIGHVLDFLDSTGELDNTIVVYLADHGDFAGEHGLFHKNFGIYDSIQHIPLLIRYPGGPQGVQCPEIVEAVDLYPTVCELCGVPVPDVVDGTSVLPALDGSRPGKDAAYCEWNFQGEKVAAIRTKEYRLVLYQKAGEGELYDHRSDPGEVHNVWDDPACQAVKSELMQQLLKFTMNYATRSNMKTDAVNRQRTKHTPTVLLHTGKAYWSQLKQTYSTSLPWPPREDEHASS